MLSAKYPTRYRRKLISSFTREPEVSIARNDLADNFFRGRCVGLFGHDAGSGVSGKSSGIDLAVETGSADAISRNGQRRVDCADDSGRRRMRSGSNRARQKRRMVTPSRDRCPGRESHRRFAKRLAAQRSQNTDRSAVRWIYDRVTGEEEIFERPLSRQRFHLYRVAGGDFVRRCTTTSISAVCGNMSSGVTESMVN